MKTTNEKILEEFEKNFPALKEDLENEGYDYDQVIDFILIDSIDQAIAEERKSVRENLPKIITPTVEPPPNNLSQNQIFASGQINMLLRVYDVLDYLDKPVTKKE